MQVGWRLTEIALVTILQDPHQGAEKKTRVGSGAATSSWKLSTDMPPGGSAATVARDLMLRRGAAAAWSAGCLAGAVAAHNRCGVHRCGAHRAETAERATGQLAES